MFPFLQTNITSQMWPNEGRGGGLIQANADQFRYSSTIAFSNELQCKLEAYLI